MIYFIYLFGLTIIGTTAFLISVIKLVLKEMVDLNYWQHLQPVHIVEERHDIIKVTKVLSYVDMQEASRYPMGYHNYLNQQVIANDAQKQYYIDKECQALVKQMLHDRLIEITEIEDYTGPPFLKTISMTVRALRPQN